MARRNYRTSSRRTRNPGLLLAVFGLIALIGFGVVGTLWIAGVPLNPFASDGPEEDPFMVRIPINSQPIPAYTRVDRSHLLNPFKGGLMYQNIPPNAVVGTSIVGIDATGSHVESRVEAVKNVDDRVVFVLTGGEEISQSNTIELGGAIMNVNAIIGRVVKADKRIGLGFREETFFPSGTPEGLAGATPQGMRAVTLDATRLTGVHSLNAGDRIDLLANVPINSDESSESEPDSEVQLLAQEAKVLRPVYVRNEVTTSSTLMSGKTTKNEPKYEVAIAVAADDVIALQEAINHRLSITCVAHSMKPTDGNLPETIASVADTVRVPVTVRPILAYQVVSRDAFVSPATRSIKVVEISRQEAERRDVIMSLGDALGAITRQDIPAGRYLRHSDLLKGPPSSTTQPDDLLEASGGSNLQTTSGKQFVTLPQQPAPVPAAPAATAVGDRPALTRFIPPGRTAFAIPLNQIYGGEHLQIGDSFDLMASYSLERLRDQEETETRPDGTVIVRKSESLTPRSTQRSWEESFGNRAEPWFVATDAIVVAPVGFPAPAAALRAIEAAGNTRANGANGQALGGPAVIIAVESRDVEAVATAMATKDALFSVAFHAEKSDSSAPERKTIAIAPESIVAFSALSETSWQGNRRSVATRSVSESDTRFANALTPRELATYYGRVLNVDKTRGDFFTADDFLAAGTGEGIAATARDGFTLLPIADREIEGLDSFERDDRVTILIRGVFKNQLTNRLAPDGGVAASYVVTESARIARSSVGGQSILEVPNQELTRLQSALARSLTDAGELNDRSHLVAVAIERRASDRETEVASGIPSFDPLENVKTTELIVGGRRTLEVYGGSSP